MGRKKKQFVSELNCTPWHPTIISPTLFANHLHIFNSRENSYMNKSESISLSLSDNPHVITCSFVDDAGLCDCSIVSQCHFPLIIFVVLVWIYFLHCYLLVMQLSADRKTESTLTRLISEEFLYDTALQSEATQSSKHYYRQPNLLISQCL